MARADLIKEINDLIDRKHGFYCADFEISSKTPKQDNQTLTIKYRFSPNFHFTAAIPRERTSIKQEYGSPLMELVIKATHSPGELNTEENITLRGRSQLLEGIGDWLDWLNNEIIAVPVQRRLKQQEEIIEKMVGDLNGLDDEYFTFEDSEIISNKLKDLELKFTSELNNQIKDKEELNLKIQEMKKDIGYLRKTVETLSKKGWASALANRVFKWSINPKNSKTIETGVKTVKALIGGSPEE